MDPTGSSSSLRSHPRPFALKNSSTNLKRNSDFFRSRLPNDPFSFSALRGRAPIVINSESLYRAVSDSHATRHVVLVLGDPSLEDLAPLLYSERLAFSLLIIASPQPPTILFKVQPAIRILRLVEPLALEQLGVEQLGAVRVLNILEWAERVARTWRKLGGSGIEELSEYDQEVGFGSLAPPRVHRLRTESNSSSLVSHPDSASSSASTSSLDKLFFRVKRGYRTERSPPPVDPSQRPFDALINYLPSNISDKAVLKHVILVTTVSRSFLIAAPMPSTRPQAQGTPRNRMSVYSMLPAMFSSEGSTDGLLNDSPLSNVSPSKAHLVHLLPPRPRNWAADRLVDSIETFLLSFSFPPSLEIRDASSATEPARTCLLESTAFAEPVGMPLSLSMNWTVADTLLSGLLDDEPTPRVRLSGASDVVIAALPPAPASLTPLRAAHLNPHTLSSPATTPGSSLPSSNSPSLPDSEENMVYRPFSPVQISPVQTRSEKRSWGWKLWNRFSTATPLAH